MGEMVFDPQISRKTLIFQLYLIVRKGDIGVVPKRAYGSVGERSVEAPALLPILSTVGMVYMA
jgi:hypothetical protein